MMNRIEKVFKKTKPFIGYLTAGDGGIEYTLNCALALVAGGVDILEIGFPFSDPVADGPIIQRAHERALSQRTTSKNILEIAIRLRQQTDVPLVLFSYFNTLLQRGDGYLNDLKSAGFDGILVVDLAVPLNDEKSEPFFQKIEEAGLISILLATPSTKQERLEQMSEIAKGFLYYVSQKGTTGIRTQMANDFSEQMKRIKSTFKIPVVAGFGIADQPTAKAALKHADGFVVGSAIVNKISEKITSDELTAFAKSIDPRPKEGRYE